MKLTDRIAVVTGAGDAVGAAIALGYANEGADLYLHDFEDKADGLETVAVAARETGRKVVTGIFDITHAGPAAAMAADVIENFGRADILVCATGERWAGHFLECSEEVWDRTVDRGLKAQFLANQQIGKEMARRGSGKIINLSAVAGNLGQSGEVPWGAAKGGTHAMSFAIAQSLGEYGVNVTVLSHGPREDNNFYTDDGTEERLRRLPFGRLAQPSDAVGPAIFLASDESGWITGSVLYADGGFVSAAATDVQHRVTEVPYRGD